MQVKIAMIVLGMVAAVALPSFGVQRHMMQPRVPEDQLAEARALRNPLPSSVEVLERGKSLYQGKGTCFNCHGEAGGGDGKAAVGLDPPPRNFRHHGFWRHRTEGEIFWVIKHGIPNTGMVAFGSVLTDDEIWAIIRYERSFAGAHHGPRRGMGSNERKCCSESVPAQ